MSLVPHHVNLGLQVFAVLFFLMEILPLLIQKLLQKIDVLLLSF